MGEGTRLSDLAYARILETLFEQRIAAGAFLSQTELVELTGVPVGPLRDALRALEAEGVLTIHPRSGIQFVKPGLELTRSTYQFRSIIEVAAVAVFAEIAAEEVIEHLAHAHHVAENSLQTHGLSASIREDLERLEELLHGSIVASLNNPLIETSYRRIRNYLRLLRLDRKITVPLALRSLREHIVIIDACRERSVDKAVAALQAHFNAALQRNLGLHKF